MPVVKVQSEDTKECEQALVELNEYFSSLESRRGEASKFLLKTYGCQLNESDSEKLSGYLVKMGLTETFDDKKADVIVFNTCAVRENAEDRLFGNLGVIKNIKSQNKDLLVVVCGCMTKVDANVERIRKSFPYVDLVFDPQQLHLFPLYLRDALRSRRQLVNISAIDYIADDSIVPISRKRKFRALVPIMYGCNNFCTYCIVPYARGRERSREFGDIIGELNILADKGYKEVMLLGQNVNSYQSPDGKTFLDLLEAASDIGGFDRIRFMSSHPKDISDGIISLMASRSNIETHLHLPLQSGSDNVLKRMNRPYRRDDFLSTAMLFRNKLPEGALSTDIIVGFPGETEEDFRATLDVVKKCAFDSAFTFQFSPRPGTAASKMEDQIAPDIVKDRFGRLLELQNDLAVKSNLSLVGGTYKVLIEGESSTSPDILTGRTMSNHLVNFTIPDNLKIKGAKASDYEGLLCDVKVDRARPYSVDGKMVSIYD